MVQLSVTPLPDGWYRGETHTGRPMSVEGASPEIVKDILVRFQSWERGGKTYVPFVGEAEVISLSDVLAQRRLDKLIAESIDVSLPLHPVEVPYHR